MNQEERNLLELLESVPNRYLLRSRSVNNLLELDQINRPTIVTTDNNLSQRINESLITSEFVEQSYSHIGDPEEREEAQKELITSLNLIIRKERQDNLKVLEDNTKFIKELSDENEKLKIEFEVIHEQVLNNKALLEETNNKLYRAQDELRNKNFDIFKQEIIHLKKIIRGKRKNN